MQIPETQIKLNNGQIQALSQIAQFLNSPNDDIFILRGSTGTGKTTLIGHLLALLARQKINATSWLPPVEPRESWPTRLPETHRPFTVPFTISRRWISSSKQNRQTIRGFACTFPSIRTNPHPACISWMRPPWLETASLKATRCGSDPDDC